MDFCLSKLKNVFMPARHISSQSFDEILSDLGDDPAIPDPHGIRKPPPHPGSPPRSQSHSKGTSFTEPLNHIHFKNSLQAFAGPIILIAVLIAVAVAFFVAYSALKNQSQDALEDSQKQISELKKAMDLIRHETHQDQDDLYMAIEELEVSIHSLMNKKPEIRTSIKPQTPAHESELRRWRYLGASQMGASHQAYFHTGSSHLVFERGAQILGDWRLSNIEKELVTLSHPQGKSLVLKAFKSE